MGNLDGRANLSGRVAAVVGGATGIGEAVSLALAEAGVDVALCDIRADAVPGAVQKVRALGRRALGVEGDACDLDVLRRFYAAIGAEFGQLDIVVNVAGGTVRKAFMDMDGEDFASDLRRNFGYVLDSVRLAVPLAGTDKDGQDRRARWRRFDVTGDIVGWDRRRNFRRHRSARLHQAP